MVTAAPGAPAPGEAATRRRGDALLRAIHEAAIAEVAEVGYASMTMEGVAERAHTGKASLYRRWPSKLDLVLDALDQLMPQVDEVPDTGDVRADLLVLLRRIARTMRGRVGCAARLCMDGVNADTDLAKTIHARVLEPRLRKVMEILRRGVERGQVRPEAVTPRIAEMGPMLLNAELRHHGTLRDRAVVEILDEIIMPLLRPPTG